MTMRTTPPAAALLLVLLGQAAYARELHASVNGNDSNDGSPSRPYRTISAAAALAQPGDAITVHEGTYRERVTPPRGGESDTKRIVYQAAPGEKAVIKGSEAIRDWKPFMPGVWKATLPASFFGGYNPYKDPIVGDWFTDKGRPHHTGEVYLNGKSLWETHLLERVLNPQPAPDIRDREGSTWVWFTESDDKNTYIYANFHDKNPNRELVEINVRDSCFYPDQPGRDYITVRGFHMSQAATQWAAPTAEQIGLIGTHWSQGWIIENNVISDSKCVGISLGKDRKTGHNVWINDPQKDVPTDLSAPTGARAGSSRTMSSATPNAWASAWARTARPATMSGSTIRRRMAPRITTKSLCVRSKPAGREKRSGPTSYATTSSSTVSRPGLWEVSAPCSARSQTTTSTTSGPSGSSPARKWRASNCTARSTWSSGATASTTPAAGCGWTGWPRARGSRAISSTTTARTTCLSKWTTGHSWWTIISSSPA